MEHRTTTIGQAQSKKEKRSSFLCKAKQLLQQTRAVQEETKQKNALLSALSASRAELETIRNHLHFVTDTDSTEICIYRLKAAELDLNRRIKLAKADLLTGREETL